LKPANLLLCLVLCLHTLIAGAGDWEIAGQLPGVPSGGIVKHNGALYAGAPTGIFKSVDKGFSWTKTTGVLPGRDALVLVSFSGALYAQSTFGNLFDRYAKLFRSNDDGASWIELTGVKSMTYSTSFPYAAGNALYIVSSEGLVKSRDGGTTWVAASNGLPDKFPSRLFTVGNTLYAAMRGLYKSTDDGASWQLVKPDMLVSGAGVGVLGTTLFTYVEGSGIVKSQEGATWEKAGDLPAGTVPLILHEADGVLYVGSFTGLYKSTDAGKTWVATGNLGNVAVVSISSANGVLYVTTANSTGILSPIALLTSADQGDSFTKAGMGLPILTNLLGTAKGAVLTETAQGKFLSRDGGNTWKTTDNAELRGIFGDYLAGDCRVYRLSEPVGDIFMPGGRDFCHILVGDTLYTSGLDGLFRSRDGGASWEVLTGPWPTFRSTLLSVGSDLYAGVAKRVMISHDGGVTWTNASNGLPDEFVSRLFDGGVAIFAAMDSGLYKSVDGGATWSAANIGPGISGTNVRSLIAYQGWGYASVGGAEGWDAAGLYRSDDGGASWIKENLGGSAIQVFELAIGNGIPYAGSDAGILRLNSPPSVAQGGIYLCDVSAGGASLGSAYLVVGSDASGKTLVTNPALSPAPRFYGKVSGIVAGNVFHGTTSGGTGWNGTFSGTAFNFASAGADASSGSCRLIFDNQAPASAPLSGSYTCDLGAAGSTEVVLTVNSASQAVVTNPATAPATRYFGYVLGTLAAKNYSGTTNSGDPWNAVFEGNSFIFTTGGSGGTSGGRCTAFSG